MALAVEGAEIRLLLTTLNDDAVEPLTAEKVNLSIHIRVLYTAIHYSCSQSIFFFEIFIYLLVNQV